MYDYTLQLQVKQRMEELTRANERRHWLRDLLNAQKAEQRAARRGQTARANTDRSQYE